MQNMRTIERHSRDPELIIADAVSILGVVGKVCGLSPSSYSTHARYISRLTQLGPNKVQPYEGPRPWARGAEFNSYMLPLCCLFHHLRVSAVLPPPRCCYSALLSSSHSFQIS